MHTSYWPEWEGDEYKRSGSRAIESRQTDPIDDLHAWYHKRSTITVPARVMRFCGIHVYDSVTVIEKRKKNRPGMLRGGGQF